MKKIFALLGDVAVAVGCCIGVGFLSGKEAQVFFGNVFNVVIFAVAFFIANYTLREYCRANNCSTVDKLSGSLFPRASKYINLGIALCSFVCIVTVLAGVEQCLASLFYLSKLPLYAFAASLIATILLKQNMKALKYANFASIVMAVILLTVLLLKNKQQHVENLDVPLYQPLVYALFTVTMSLGVTTRLACDISQRGNVIACILTSVITSILMYVVLRLCHLNANLPALNTITQPALLVYAIVTLLFAAVTGIVANAYPIVQELKSIIPDDTVSNALIFGCALAFSMFGFDFAVKIGYLLVSIFGAALITVASCKLLSKFLSRIRKHSLKVQNTTLPSNIK